MRRIRHLHRAAVPFVAVAALAAGLLAAAPAAAESRSVRLVLEGVDLTESWLTSSVQDPQLAFSAVGSHWKDVPGTELELSVSPDGVRWGRWIGVPPDEPIDTRREDGTPNPFAGETLGALIFVDPSSRFLRCRVRSTVDSPAPPEPGRISFHVIDPGASRPDGPARAPADALPESEASLADSEAANVPRRAVAPPPEIPGSVPGAPKPHVFTRTEWGARPPRTGYSFTVAGHIGIHHTATVEDFAASTWEECAARVRAIQTYHIDANGWNDIGYAYVVCKHGHVFQAREDDDDSTDVQGAHDGFNKGSAGISAFGYFHPPVNHQPTEAQISAVVQLTAWIASRRGIDPLGRGLYAAFGAPVDNIYGHREVSATACPGDNLHARMDAIRTAVADRVLRLLL